MPTVDAPPGWKWRPLSELARLESGHTPSRKHPEYWGGDVPWISIPDAKRCHGGVIDETEESTNALGLANSSARLIPASAVCLSRTASVGYVTITDRPMATSQDFVNWICGNQLLPKFLQYLFIAEGESLLRFASGAVHKTIYFPEVKAFHVCVPDVAMQRRIVAILDEAFEGIATAKANAEKNLQNARELFESVLDESLSTHGEGAIETTLGAEVELLAGYAFPSVGYTESARDARLLRGDNIMQGYLRWDDAKRWPVDNFEPYARFALREGDVVLAMDRPWVKAGLKRAQMSAADLPCLQVQRTARLRPKDTLREDFLFHLTGSRSFSRHLQEAQTGIGVPHISGKQIESFRFMRPSKTTQIGIARILDEVLANTQRLSETYERKLAALDELKKSLLQLAFSGQL